MNILLVLVQTENGLPDLATQLVHHSVMLIIALLRPRIIWYISGYLFSLNRADAESHLPAILLKAILLDGLLKTHPFLRGHGLDN